MKLTTKLVLDSGETIDIDVYYRVDLNNVSDDLDTALEICKTTQHNEPENLVIVPTDCTDSLIDICWKHYNGGR